MIISTPIQIVQIRPITPNYDFGTLSALDSPKVFHDFTYTNTGSTPVVVERLQPSCHCTSGMLLPANSVNLPITATGQILPTTVPAGGSVTIRVLVDLTEEPAGPVSKSLAVFLKGQDSFAAMYTITGQESADVTLTPHLLDFGKQNPDKPTSIKVTVTLDKRLSPSVFPTLSSTAEDLVISPGLIVDTKEPAGLGKPPTEVLTRTYTVSPTENMPLGAIRGMLELTPTSSSPDVAQMEFQYQQAVITGSVVGSVQAQPDSVSVGTIYYGQGGKAGITLYSDTLANISHVKAVGKSPYITVTTGVPDTPLDVTQDGTPPALAHHVHLNIQIDRQIGAGLFNSEIKVILPDGHRLLIPVMGYVSSLQQ